MKIKKIRYIFYSTKKTSFIVKKVDNKVVNNYQHKLNILIVKLITILSLEFTLRYLCVRL